MNISKAMGICHSEGIRIYGTNSKSKLFVQVEEDIANSPKPKITASKKLHNSKEDLNDAVTLTYFHYANKIMDLKKNP